MVIEQMVCFIALLCLIAGSSARSADADTDATAGVGAALGTNGTNILLTNGMQAPNIQMIRLADGKPEQLFDYAGKVIVLEF